MQLKLREIANVVSGYTFRGALVNHPAGDVFVLQAKNIIADQNLVGNQSLSGVIFEKVRGPFFLQNNDIAVVSRGAGIGSFRAAVFKGTENNVVASSSVFIIRLISDKVLPEYMSIFINSGEGQKRIMESVTGSYIKALLRGELLEMNVPIPSIAQQEAIVKLAENLKRQREIYERKIQIKKNILNVVFEKLL